MNDLLDHLDHRLRHYLWMRAMEAWWHAVPANSPLRARLVIMESVVTAAKTLAPSRNPTYYLIQDSYERLMDYKCRAYAERHPEHRP